MTCIVGFTDKENNVTWIGADSLGSNGYTQDVESNPKVFRNTTLKNVVIGSTSTFRHIDLLKYSKTLFPEIDKYKIPSGETKVNHEYMVTTFVPNIITLFENGIKDSGDKGGNFLVGIDGKLYEIQNDYSVLEPLAGYSAVGCGEVTAKGSLYATTKYMKDFTPEQHILTALEAAEKNCCGVQRPFVILNTKNEDIIIVGIDGKREVIKKDNNNNLLNISSSSYSDDNNKTNNKKKSSKRHHSR